MPDKKPLIVDGGQIQQLQGEDDLDIPLADRVAILERALVDLTRYLLAVGLEPPASVVNIVEALCP